MPDQPPAPPDNRGFLRRFLSPALTPEMQAGLALARKDRPDIPDPDTYGPISNAYADEPGNQAYVSPAGGMYLNQKAQLRPEDWADTIIHEQTHLDQQKRRGLGTAGEVVGRAFGVGAPEMGIGLPYGQRPDEMEAFGAGAHHARERGADDYQTYLKPSFTHPGQFYSPHDINLPTPRTDALTKRAR